MDSMEQEKRQAMAEFRRARRRISFSVVFFLLVGLLVSLSSWDKDLSLLLTGLPDCFWVDRRKAMFVLCNLILAVVAMDSGLLASFTPEEERCGEFSVTEKSHRSREEARRLSAGEDEFMFSCAHCCLHVMEAIFRYGNSWACVGCDTTTPPGRSPTTPPSPTASSSSAPAATSPPPRPAFPAAA